MESSASRRGSQLVQKWAAGDTMASVDVTEAGSRWNVALVEDLSDSLVRLLDTRMGQH